GFSFALSRASLPLAASQTAKPRTESCALNNLRLSSSSSTIRIVCFSTDISTSPQERASVFPSTRGVSPSAQIRNQQRLLRPSPDSFFYKIGLSSRLSSYGSKALLTIPGRPVSEYRQPYPDQRWNWRL